MQKKKMNIGDEKIVLMGALLPYVLLILLGVVGKIKELDDYDGSLLIIYTLPPVIFASIILIIRGISHTIILVRSGDYSLSFMGELIHIFGLTVLIYEFYLVIHALSN